MLNAARARVFIFDLDGTLIDSLRDVAEAADLALGELGFKGHPLDAYRYFVGEGARALIERALPEGHRDAETVDRCLAIYRARYARFWKVHTRPYAGIPEMLDGLAARGASLAVLSNKPEESVLPYMREWFARWPFDPIFGAVPSRPLKPDPSGALEIASRLGVAPEECVFVGDSRTDIETARAAGMFGVGVLWGFRTREELVGAGADAVIASPGELLKLGFFS